MTIPAGPGRRAGSRGRRPLAAGLASVTLALLGTGCSVSVHAGYGNPAGEQAYRAAIARPMSALTARAASANATCAGGSHPSPSACLANTTTEINSARALESAMRGVPTPARFAKANGGMLRGLDVFVRGLVMRNAGLAAHSAAEYSAGQNLVGQGLALQRSAIAEYPADAKIRL